MVPGILELMKEEWGREQCGFHQCKGKDMNDIYLEKWMRWKTEPWESPGFKEQAEDKKCYKGNNDGAFGNK